MDLPAKGDARAGAFATYRLASAPPSASGAIAIVELRGDLERACAALGLATVCPGEAAYRRWRSVDELIIARFDKRTCLLFPHAGAAVLARVVAALERAGIVAMEPLRAEEAFPEARSRVEARMLAALARARSPLAIDILLQQPSRWERHERGIGGVMSAEESGVLRRVIEPALVVAMGPANIGKSSLLNELAGRRVAIVADEPGTTRDHVGVDLTLGGLVVRYLDTPGMDEHQAASAEEARVLEEARAVAMRMAASADLVLLCADAGSEYRQPPGGVSVLRVGLRSDLGAPRGGADVLTSVRARTGINDLVSAMREALVPASLLGDQRAWTFWHETAEPS